MKLSLQTYSNHKVTFTNPKLTKLTSSDPTVTYCDLQWPLTHIDHWVTFLSRPFALPFPWASQYQHHNWETLVSSYAAPGAGSGQQEHRNSCLDIWYI